MLTRNDQPFGLNFDFANDGNFNFAVDSVFSVRDQTPGGIIPPVENDFLLLDGTNFLLLDTTNFLLL